MVQRGRGQCCGLCSGSSMRDKGGIHVRLWRRLRRRSPSAWAPKPQTAEEGSKSSLESRVPSRAGPVSFRLDSCANHCSGSSYHVCGPPPARERVTSCINNIICIPRNDRRGGDIRKIKLKQFIARRQRGRSHPTCRATSTISTPRSDGATDPSFPGSARSCRLSCSSRSRRWSSQ